MHLKVRRENWTLNNAKYKTLNGIFHTNEIMIFEMLPWQKIKLPKQPKPIDSNEFAL